MNKPDLYNSYARRTKIVNKTAKPAEMPLWGGSRAFPLPDNSPTDQIAQADKSPTGNYPVKR